MKQKIVAALSSSTFVAGIIAVIGTAGALFATQNLISDTLEQQLAGLASVVVPPVCGLIVAILSGSKKKAAATRVHAMATLEVATAMREHTVALTKPKPASKPRVRKPPAAASKA